MKAVFDKIKQFYSRYERILLPVSFLMGFLWDNFTLSRIDQPYVNLVFITNLLVAGISIILVGVDFKSGFWLKMRPPLQLILQFVFGNLFSGFFIFYIRSGSIFVSWPLVAIIAILFFGSDFLRKKYQLLSWQVPVYFITIFLYFVFLLPILLNKMGEMIFLLSGISSLLTIAVILLIIFLSTRWNFRQNFKIILAAVSGIYIFFNFLYFTNLIPPLPLSVKQSGIYHIVDINPDGNFRVAYEPETNPFLFFKDQSDTFHWIAGGQVYFFSAVFSPADLNVKILHRWSYFDAERKKWVQTDSIPMPRIIGGREGGYRDYSFKVNVRAGKWRVEVITERGQVISRRSFYITEVKEPPELKTAIR
jgi:hypothetical protein